MKINGAAVFLALASYAYAVEFESDVEGTSTRPGNAPCGPFSLTGKAEHGDTQESITETGEYCIDFATQTVSGRSTQTSSDNSELYIEWSGPVVFDGLEFEADGSFTITGGTGRFVSVSGGGNFEAEGQVDPTSAPDVSSTLEVEYDGSY